MRSVRMSVSAGHGLLVKLDLTLSVQRERFKLPPQLGGFGEKPREVLRCDGRAA